MSRLRACVFLVLLACGVASASDDQQSDVARMSQDLQSLPPAEQRNLANGFVEILRGRKIFRFDTFGDQAFWGDTLKLHQAIEGADHGGIGPGVGPGTALAVGLKVDVDALPQPLKQKLAAGRVDLNDPANTLALLQLNAVVGVTGFFDQQQRLISMGIQCALCHSTVDNSFAPGIGRRLDGWPNRDLNVGAIINLSPDLSAFTNALQVDDATVRSVLLSWGPGKFDAALLLDGKAFRPDGKSAATLIPAAFGLAVAPIARAARTLDDEARGSHQSRVAGVRGVLSRTVSGSQLRVVHERHRRRVPRAPSH